jgi:hypothetical protein
MVQLHCRPFHYFSDGQPLTTYLPSVTADGQRALIVEYQGKVGCEAAGRIPLEGVLTVAEDDLLRDMGKAGVVVGVPASGIPVLHLCTYCGPGSYQLFSYFAWLGAAGGLLALLQFWRNRRAARAPAGDAGTRG